MSEIKPFFSEDLLLGDFNTLLDIFNENPKVRKESYLMFISELFKFNSTYLDERSHLSLDLRFNNNGFFHEILRFLEKCLYKNFPNFMISYSDIKYDSENGFINLLCSKLQKNLKFYNKTNSRLLNSTINYVNTLSDSDSTANKIILDKILINLHTIALQSHQNDDKFLDIVQERVNQVFQIYLIKKKLVKKKLHDSKSWNRLISSFFPHIGKNWINSSLKSLSFFGLNKAIKVQCGIEIDRIEKSEKFALDVLNLIKDLINEKNSEENEFFFINQPHDAPYLCETWINSHSLQDDNGPAYSMDLIRKESKLDINRQLELFKKFESILDGGSLYNFYYKSNKDHLIENIKKIISSKLPAFSIFFD
jgi:anaerobic ribonucleoside-triphosphate reductase